jgi:hypothetical protein
LTPSEKKPVKTAKHLDETLKKPFKSSQKTEGLIFRNFSQAARNSGNF